ncbi:MAG: hypothetical protein RL701_4080 [Pseudomonadota bacterium]|jgi:outer membrane protein OmpA-like peptidoglycan-associated protein
MAGLTIPVQLAHPQPARRRRWRWLRLAGLSAAIGLIVTPAFVVRAQPLDLGNFAPTPQPALTFTIPEPLPRGHLTLHFGLAGDFATSLIARGVDCAGQEPADLACLPGLVRTRSDASWSGRANALFELALFDLISVGVRLPLALTRAETAERSLQTYGGVGDVGLVISGALASVGSTQVGWQLAATLPTAAAYTFAGEPYVTLTPGFTLSQRVGPVVIGAQLAYHLRKRSVVLGVERDDELVAKLGARYEWLRGFAILAEYSLLWGIGGRSALRPESPAELDLGVRLGDLSFLALDVGIGTAAWPGERGLGAPGMRAFLTLRGSLGPSGCTTGPEDRDGFEDSDGCADLDNDADGVPDAVDACPNDAEDRDGFNDDDGCPEIDNDADGLSDARDLCPEYSEDIDGFQDADGCPEPDNDEDNVADGSDHCRLDPEDRDGYEDDDGCPEPGPARPTVTRSGSRLLISDRVYFEDESDTLRAVSAPLLDAVAATFKDLPGKARLRVEGHTDDSGNAQYNVDLSYRRARAVVEYLKRQGIEAERLEYIGHGSAQPLGPNTRPEGRALNRRVEFVLLGQ